MPTEYAWLLTLPSLIGIALLGMITHFMKKQIKGESLSDITLYFKSHFKSTLIAIVTTVASTVGYYFTLSTEMPADAVTVFLLGYMFDSTLNKWDNTSTIKQ